MSEPKTYTPSVPPLTPHLPMPASLTSSTALRLQQPRWDTESSMIDSSHLSRSVPNYIPRVDMSATGFNSQLFDSTNFPRNMTGNTKDLESPYQQQQQQQVATDYFTTPRFSSWVPGPDSTGMVGSPATPSAPGPSGWAPPAKEDDPWYNPAFAPAATATTPTLTTRSPKKGGKGPKKVDGKQPTFLTKLYDVLNNAEFHHIIRWDDAGEIIIIERPDELADKVLPLIYRQSRFASFSRQLNIYGWMRKVSLRHVESGIVDPDASTWSHTFLRRDSTKEEILSFKRRVPPRPSQAQKNAARLQQETLSVSSDSDGFNSPPDAYPNPMLADLDETKQIIFATPDPNSEMPPPSSSHSDASMMVENSGGLDAATIESHRRFSMPSSIGRPNVSAFQPTSSTLGRQFALQNNNHLKHVPHKSMSLNLTYASSSFMTPQSAPPGGSMFPGASNTLQFTSGNGVATPSLTDTPAFSPASTLSGLFLNDDAITTDDEYDRVLRGTQEPPSFSLHDPSTWVRRGLGTLGDGMRPIQVAPLDSVPQYYMFQPVTINPNNNPLPDTSSSSLFSTKTPTSVDMLTTTSNPLPASSPMTSTGTVSPGAYQGVGFPMGNHVPMNGFNNVSPRGTPVLGARAATATKIERRNSQTGPYSPPRSRAPQLMGASTMPARNIGGRRETIDGSSLFATPEVVADSDLKNGLPSAYLPAPELFSGELNVRSSSTNAELDESL